jgi:hypothetical protein
MNILFDQVNFFLLIQFGALDDGVSNRFLNLMVRLVIGNFLFVMSRNCGEGAVEVLL